MWGAFGRNEHAPLKKPLVRLQWQEESGYHEITLSKWEIARSNWRGTGEEGIYMTKDDWASETLLIAKCHTTGACMVNSEL